MSLSSLPVMVVVLVSQSPQPGRADGVASGPQTSQEDRETRLVVAPSPTLSDSFKTEDTIQKRPEIAAPNEQQAEGQAVSVRSLPPLDIPRDWVDYTQIGLTLVLLGFGIWQLVLLKRTVTANTTAANAADRSATIAKETLILTQRAYVTILAAEVANFGPRRSPKMVLKLQNIGHQPATLSYGRVG